MPRRRSDEMIKNMYSVSKEKYRIVFKKYGKVIVIIHDRLKLHLYQIAIVLSLVLSLTKGSRYR